jgi:predicted PurR-regulated permease PerM
MWGTAMAFLAIIPYLGAFIIWSPAAAFLAIQGEWWKALILVAWGTIVIGLIDNLLYPILVGGRLGQHTVIAFLAIIGGITVFGACGLVLGPVVVSLTLFLLETWRRRTRSGQAAENAA